MRALGALLLMGGLFALFGAFFFPVSVSDGLSDNVVNADALALRSMISNAGGFAAVTGAIMACLWPEPSFEGAAYRQPQSGSGSEAGSLGGMTASEFPPLQ